MKTRPGLWNNDIAFSKFRATLAFIGCRVSSSVHSPLSSVQVFFKFWGTMELKCSTMCSARYLCLLFGAGQVGLSEAAACCVWKWLMRPISLSHKRLSCRCKTMKKTLKTLKTYRVENADQGTNLSAVPLSDTFDIKHWAIGLFQQCYIQNRLERTSVLIIKWSFTAVLCSTLLANLRFHPSTYRKRQKAQRDTGLVGPLEHSSDLQGLTKVNKLMTSRRVEPTARKVMSNLILYKTWSKWFWAQSHC